MKFGKIYLITNDINSKVYVGQTIQTLNKRFNGHCCYSKSDRSVNMYIKRAIHKYGRDKFHIQLIEECPVNILNEREKYWINFYNSYYNGYNATLGGDGQCKYNYDEIVNYYLAHDNSLLQTCQHFKIYDQVVYTALKSKNINYKNLTSFGNSGNKNKYCKKILCVELNLYFNKMKDIDDYFNKIVHPNIRRCLNGITKKAYGYTWRELEEGEEENYEQYICN